MASNLIQEPILTALDDNGDTISGAKLYIYEAGTTTPIHLFLDASLSDLNVTTNPEIADAAGRFVPMWGRAGQAYKLVLKDAADVEIWTVDDLFVTSTEGLFVPFPLRKVYKVSIPTLLVDGVELFNLVIERDYIFKAQSTRNKAICRTLPTADFTCSVKKNGVEVMTIDFTAGNSSATMTGTMLDIPLAENDILSCDPPVVIDATAARFALSFELDLVE